MSDEPETFGAGPVTRALVGSIPIVGSATIELFGRYIQDGEEKSLAAIHRSQHAWMTDLLPEIEDRLRTLEERLAESAPTAADVFAFVEAVGRVSRKTADSEKRRLLRAAVVNAFDPEMYEQGLTLRLLSILEELEYGDVAFLRQLDEGESLQVVVEGRHEDWPVSLARHHVGVLLDSGLVETNQENVSAPRRIPGSLYGAVTVLGNRLLQLVAEPAQDDEQETDDEGES